MPTAAPRAPRRAASADRVAGRPGAWALWPLPVAIAALLVVAVHLAWGLSLHAGHVPACIPHLDGCTSISRAARHGVGNHVFRLLVLPCAVLQGLHWWWLRAWLRVQAGPASAARGAGVPLLGAVAAVALALYATFLGSDGDVYRLLRRYGVVAYFAATYLAQLLQLRALVALRLGRPVQRRAMTAVCVGMLLLGVLSVGVSALVEAAAARDRWENVLEWQLGVLLVAWFLLQGWLWRDQGLRLQLLAARDVAAPGDPAA